MNLLERLRAVESSRGDSDRVSNWHRNPDGPEAANEIEKLRGITRLQDAVIRSGGSALTTAEREAVELAIAVLCGSQDIEDTDGLEAAAALRELLDRHHQPDALSPMTISTGPEEDDEEDGRIWDSAKNKPD